MYHFYGWEKATVQDAGGRTPRDYYDLLSEIWCEGTCAPRMRDRWSPENKTLGQCSITAFLMQDIFGGKVYGIPLEDGGFHCFNVVGECAFDLTSEQFGDRVLDYDNGREQYRGDHLAKEEKRQRYRYLKGELEKRIGRHLGIRLRFIQQEDWVEPGEYGLWAERNGYETSVTRCWLYEPIPQTVDADLLVVLGGWQSPATTKSECDFYDAGAEKALIRSYVERGRMVIGVCLGAQLLGEALGGSYAHSPEREVGPVSARLTKAGRGDPLFSAFTDVFDAGEWHNDMPGLTGESVIIAESDGCPRQIIRYGEHVYGFQTHMEFTHQIVARGVEAAGASLTGSGRFEQTAGELLAYDYTEMNRMLSAFLDALVKNYVEKQAPAREKSCGAVIYTEETGNRLYLVEAMQKGHISICKGHMEGNETERETATREILEETALAVRFIDGFRETIEYSPYPGCKKTVVFFLAKADSIQTVAQKEEVHEIRWLPFCEAMETLTFDSDRKMLKKAESFLARG